MRALIFIVLVLTASVATAKFEPVLNCAVDKLSGIEKIQVTKTDYEGQLQVISTTAPYYYNGSLYTPSYEVREVVNEQDLFDRYTQEAVFYLPNWSGDYKRALKIEPNLATRVEIWDECTTLAPFRAKCEGPLLDQLFPR